MHHSTHYFMSIAGLAAALSFSACHFPCNKQTTIPPPTASANAAVTDVSASKNQSARFNAWLEAAYEQELQFSPLAMSFLGRRDRYEELDDMSMEAQALQLAWRGKSVAEMEQQFDYAALTDEDRISYDFWKEIYEREQAGEPFRYSHYVFEQNNGFQNTFPTFMINFHAVEGKSDMEAYIARLNASRRAFAQLIANADESDKRGTHIPGFALDAVIKQSQAVIDGAPFTDEGDSSLWADGKRKIAALQSRGKLSPDEAANLLTRLQQALLTAVRPAYDQLITWAQAQRAQAPAVNTGVHTQPDGQGFYAYMLRESTTTDMTADEVHQLGLREVSRIREEMVALKKKIGFEDDLQAFLAHLRTDPKNYFPDTDEGRDAYLQAATAAIDNIKQQIPSFFHVLPKADLAVRRVEAFRERDGAAQHYFPGTPDGSRPGIFYAHLSDMNAMPKNQLEVIAYHEGIPGHHLQISIAQERDDLPQFRAHAEVTAYVEGWALYSEWLAKEMGGTYQDPYADFGRLTTEMWRAVRLVVDTGLHAKGWTEDQAVEFMLQTTPEPEEGVRSEVQRYLVWPGQATSYKIGMLKLQQLRAEAEAALGERFDLAAFHDTILTGGPLPLSLLSTRVKQWIAKQH